MAQRARLTPKGFDQEMSFLEHLEQLRWHLVRGLLGVLGGMVLCLVFIQAVVDRVVLWPRRADFPTRRWLCQLGQESFCTDLPIEMQAINPSEQFVRAIVVALVGGFVLTFPYLMLELWKFVRPGLYRQEIRSARGAVLALSLLFFSGVSFAYFIIVPFAFNFFANFQLIPDVQNIWRLGSVIGLTVQLSLAGGLLFELPALAYFLAKVGILRPGVMRKYRRHAILVNFILAGILTPSPDVVSQLLLGVPMLGLYEASIRIVDRVHRRAARNQAEAPVDPQPDDQ